MKLSIESFALRARVGDHEGLRLIKNAGFDCVDMSYYWTGEHSPLLDDGYREYAYGLKEHMNALGLECNQAHAPFEVKYGELFELSNPKYLAVVRSIESAAILGAKTIIVHAIGHKADGRVLLDLEYNLNYYKSLQPYCERFGICVAVENLFVYDDRRAYYKGRLGTPAELCDFVRRLNSPCFVACVDVGHAALTGNEPQDFIAAMDASILRAVHIQDGDYRGDRHMLPYLGSFDWNAIMKALKQVGYDGELTFEIFNYLKGIPNELIPDALSFAAKTGRHMISVFEKL